MNTIGKKRFLFFLVNSFLVTLFTTLNLLACQDPGATPLTKIIYQENDKQDARILCTDYALAGTTIYIRKPPETINSSGKIFSYWYSNSSESEQIKHAYLPNYAFVIPEEKEITFTARWKEKNQFLIYYDQGNTLFHQDLGEADSFNITPNPHPKIKTIFALWANKTLWVDSNGKRYYFAGWNTKMDGRGIQYEGEEVYVPSKDIVLYAQWYQEYTTGGIREEQDKRILRDTKIENIYNFFPKDKEFNGILDGRGYTIYLTTDRPNRENYIGLFGKIGKQGIVRNLFISFEQNATLKTKNIMGAIAGKNEGVISRVRVLKMKITATADKKGNGGQYIGGLVGWNAGLIQESMVQQASVAGIQNVGGLVGINLGTIKNTFSDANVKGYSAIGGLVGYMMHGRIENSYTTGKVEGISQSVGALIGWDGPTTHIISIYSDAQLKQPPDIGTNIGTSTEDSYRKYMVGLYYQKKESLKQEEFPGWDFKNIWLWDSFGPFSPWPKLRWPLFNYMNTDQMTP